jgi:hypothetical protein
MPALKVRIAEILSRTEARSVALVFEASQRADPLVMHYFEALELLEGGNKIPVQHCLLAKSAGEPALEVADFVMHSLGNAARRRLEGKPGIPADFNCVFLRCQPHLASIMFIDRIEEHPDESMDEAIGFGLAFPDGSPIKERPVRAISFPPE